MNEDMREETAMSEASRRRGRRAWRIVLFLCLAIIAASVVLRLMKPEEPMVTVPLSSVSVSEPERGDIEIETSLVGTVMPASVYYVMPKTSGEIREIYVQQGDTVNEGDPICRIDNDNEHIWRRCSHGKFPLSSQWNSENRL